MEGCIRYSKQPRRYILKNNEIRTSYVNVPYYVKNKNRNKTHVNLTQDQTNDLLEIYNSLKYPNYSKAHKLFIQKNPDINITYYHAIKIIKLNN